MLRIRIVRQLTVIVNELKVRLLAEDQTMRRTSVMEHSNFLSLRNKVVLLDGDLASRHLGHSNGNEAHRADLRVFGLDENQDASGNLGDVCLGFDRIGYIGTRQGGVISAWNENDLYDLSRHRSVPAVVTAPA